MAQSDYKLSLLITARDAATPAISSLRQSLTRLNKEVNGAGLSAALGRGFSAGGWTGAVSNAIGLFGQLGKAGIMAFGVMGTAASSALGPISAFATASTVALSTLAYAGISVVTSGLKALGATAVTAGAAVYGFIKALEPAGQMEQFQMQLEVMLGTAEKARNRLKEYMAFDKSSNFEIQGIAAAGNLMEAFGFYSKRNFDAAGNAASAFNKDLTEVVRTLAYLKSGRAGEAFESLAQIGIKREDLELLGIKFTKSKELISSAEEAFDAVIRVIESRFDGMMKKQSTTLQGRLSSLSSAVFNTMAKAGGGLLKYVKPAIESVTNFIDSLGDRISKFDWSRIGTSILTGVKAAESVINRLLDPKQRAADLQMLTGKDGLIATLTGGIGSIMKGVFSDGAATLATVFSNLPTYLSLGFEVMRGVFGWAWAGLKEILFGAWEALDTRIQDSFMMAFSVLPNWMTGIKDSQRYKLYQEDKREARGRATLDLYRESDYKKYPSEGEVSARAESLMAKRYQIQTPGLNGLSVAMAEKNLSAAQAGLNGILGQLKFDLVTVGFDKAMSSLMTRLSRFEKALGSIWDNARKEAESMLKDPFNLPNPSQYLEGIFGKAPQQDSKWAKIWAGAKQSVTADRPATASPQPAATKPDGLYKNPRLGEGWMRSEGGLGSLSKSGLSGWGGKIPDSTADKALSLQRDQVAKLQSIENELKIFNRGLMEQKTALSAVASYIAGVA